jgi:hypothetical protein
MAYVPKPNTGTLWQNDYKKADNHPDLKGDLFLDRSFLEELLGQSNDDLIKVAVSSWEAESNGRRRFSLSVSLPYVKQVPVYEKQQTAYAKPPKPIADEEEIPF